jgi:hypothetical protein
LDKWSVIVNAGGEGEDLYKRSHPPQCYLNESFTALAFNILHCIIRYGCLESQGMPTPRATENVKWAKLAIKGLAKKYPERIPEYCRSILELGDE